MDFSSGKWKPFKILFALLDFRIHRLPICAVKIIVLIIPSMTVVAHPECGIAINFDCSVKAMRLFRETFVM
jgi:hypothetical protein